MPLQEVASTNVTTTSTIEGWEVEAYLGTVVAHSVVGAGLVTEFFAGLSDVFGGRSNAVRARLAELYDDATAQLRRNAAVLGANWIVGLRVDVDEVSGKGTFMFMVTATGTAILARSLSSGSVAHAEVANMSLAKFQVLARTQEILANATPDALNADEEMLRFLCQNKVLEAAPLVLAWARSATTEVYPDIDRERERRITRAAAFFDALPPMAAVDQLYRNVKPEPIPDWNAELVLVRRLHLLSFARTASLLESSSQNLRWWGLQSLRAHQSIYAKSDIAEIDRCIAAIDTDLFREAPLEEVPRALGFGKKLAWRCLAGHLNDEGRTTCSCGIDRRGLDKNDIKPAEARATLLRMRQLLTTTFDPLGECK